MNKLITGYMVFFLMAVPCLGCAGKQTVKTVKPGERIMVQYTCRAKGYGVIETTDAKLAQDRAVQKSRVFDPDNAKGAVRMTAGKEQPGQVPGALKSLTPEIRSRIAYALVGKPYNAVSDILIESRVPEGINEAFRYRDIERVRIVEKVQTVPRENFVRARGCEPEMGMLVYDRHKNEKDKGLPYAKVIAFDDDSVSIGLIPDNIRETRIPWGETTAADTGDGKTVAVTIRSREGMLVRVGRVIGRVVEMDEKNIRVDFGHPFAGEALECEVKIAPVEK